MVYVASCSFLIKEIKFSQSQLLLIQNEIKDLICHLKTQKLKIKS